MGVIALLTAGVSRAVTENRALPHGRGDDRVAVERRVRRHDDQPAGPGAGGGASALASSFAAPRLAARAETSEDINEIRKHLRTMAATTENDSASRAADMHFHQAVPRPRTIRCSPTCCRRCDRSSESRLTRATAAMNPPMDSAAERLSSSLPLVVATRDVVVDGVSA
jgi:hypothetical protein